MGMGGGNKGQSRVTMSEINVTPMVDVMLVLLIIFMVTAPLIQQGVKVNLPDAKATPVEAADKKLVLSIDVSRRVFIGDAEVPSTSWRRSWPPTPRPRPTRRSTSTRTGTCPMASWWRSWPPPSAPASPTWG